MRSAMAIETMGGPTELQSVMDKYQYLNTHSTHFSEALGHPDVSTEKDNFNRDSERISGQL